MRWSENEYARYLRQGPDGAMTERALQAAVVRLLTQHHYLVYHTYDSRRSPSGFPDLIACHQEPGHAALALELKTATGHVTLPQQAWLSALAQCTGIHAQVVRPADLAALVARLRVAPEPTPGQCAYEAYSAFGARVTTYPPTLWSWLAPVEQAQWDAAAQAVLEACVSSAAPMALPQDKESTP